MSVTPVEKKKKPATKPDVGTLAEGGLTPEEIGQMAASSVSGLDEVEMHIEGLAGLAKQRQEIVAKVQATLKPEQKKERGFLEKLGRTSLDVLGAATGLAPISPMFREGVKRRRSQRDKENLLTSSMLELEQLDKMYAQRAMEFDQRSRINQVNLDWSDLILQAKEQEVSEANIEYEKSTSGVAGPINAVEEYFRNLLGEDVGEDFDFPSDLSRRDTPEALELLRTLSSSGLGGGGRGQIAQPLDLSAQIEGAQHAVATYRDIYKDIYARTQVDPNQLASTAANGKTVFEDNAFQQNAAIEDLFEMADAHLKLGSFFSQGDEEGNIVWNEDEFENYADAVRALARTTHANELFVWDAYDPETGAISRTPAADYVTDFIEEKRQLAQAGSGEEVTLTDEELRRDELESRVEGRQAEQSVVNAIDQLIVRPVEELGKQTFLGGAFRAAQAPTVSGALLGLATRGVTTPESYDEIELAQLRGRDMVVSEILTQYRGLTIRGIRVIDEESAKQVFEKVFELSGRNAVIEDRLADIEKARKKTGSDSFTGAARESTGVR